jgi:hypothetical protein
LINVDAFDRYFDGRRAGSARRRRRSGGDKVPRLDVITRDATSRSSRCRIGRSWARPVYDAVELATMQLHRIDVADESGPHGQKL